MGTVRTMMLLAGFLLLGVIASASAATWPKLPTPVKNGIGIRVGDTIYVGLGPTGNALYALDLNHVNAGWVRKADYPGPVTAGAAAAASGGRIYVFSGNGLASPEAKWPTIFISVHVYDPAANQWSAVDTRTPVGLSGAKALALADGRIILLGGYNKVQFDTFLHDITVFDKAKDPEGFKALVDRYMSREPRDYRWNAQVLDYNPAHNTWRSLGNSVFPPNCDAGLAARGGDAFTLVGGEIKPGLRTPDAKTVTIAGDAVRWQPLGALPPPPGAKVQEGVAGAYAAAVGGVVLAAGGANFTGSQANAAIGHWFTHDGAPKVWRPDIYAFESGAWHVVGELPHGLGYGASFALPGGMLVVGGEDGAGKARAEVYFVKWTGTKAVVEE